MKRIAVMMAACGLAASGGAFERIAQADHWDFSGHFDVETEDGIRAIIDHIQLTGADTLAWRVSAYTFQKSGIANYAEWLGVTKAEATRKLLELAREVKADGILMECVDYRNYTPEMCDALTATH